MRSPWAWDHSIYCWSLLRWNVIISLSWPEPVYWICLHPKRFRSLAWAWPRTWLYRRQFHFKGVTGSGAWRRTARNKAIQSHTNMGMNFDAGSSLSCQWEVARRDFCGSLTLTVEDHWGLVPDGKWSASVKVAMPKLSPKTYAEDKFINDCWCHHKFILRDWKDGYVWIGSGNRQHLEMHKIGSLESLFFFGSDKNVEF